MFESALYYPTIDIHNERWLKSAALGTGGRVM